MQVWGQRVELGYFSYFCAISRTTVLLKKYLKNTYSFLGCAAHFSLLMQHSCHIAHHNHGRQGQENCSHLSPASNYKLNNLWQLRYLLCAREKRFKVSTDRWHQSVNKTFGWQRSCRESCSKGICQFVLMKRIVLTFCFDLCEMWAGLAKTHPSALR